MIACAGYRQASVAANTATPCLMRSGVDGALAPGRISRRCPSECRSRAVEWSTDIDAAPSSLPRAGCPRSKQMRRNVAQAGKSWSLGGCRLARAWRVCDPGVTKSPEWAATVGGGSCGRAQCDSVKDVFVVASAAVLGCCGVE